MRPGMWSMVTLSFDSSLYAVFFPALSGKTAGSPAPGPVRHFRPMATILSWTRPSGWGGRGYSRCAQSALSSACRATGDAGGRSGSRQMVSRHLSSRGSSHTRRRGPAAGRPGGWPAVRPWRRRQPAAPPDNRHAPGRCRCRPSPDAPGGAPASVRPRTRRQGAAPPTRDRAPAHREAAESGGCG